MTVQMTEQSTRDLQEFVQGPPASAERAAAFLKSIAHKDRLKVLCCLLGKEVSVSELESTVGISQSAMSQHLGKLRDEGIVSARRDGRQIYYSISDPTVLEIVAILYARFCKT